MNEKKILIFTSAIIFIAEIIIFFSAFSISGTSRWLQVKNSSGDLLYEVKGDRLPSFDKYYFENNFGPLDKYKISLIEKYSSFPVRGWLFASIAFPVGIFILGLFFIKAIVIFFPSFSDQINFDLKKGFTIKLPFVNFKLNIYLLLVLVLAISFLLWALPILFDSAIVRFLYLISSYPIFFSIFFGALFFIVIYLLYLRYRLKKFEVEKKYAIELKRVEAIGSSIENKTIQLIENTEEHLDNNGD